MKGLAFNELEEKFKACNPSNKDKISFKSGEMGILLFAKLIYAEVEKQDVKQPYSILSNVDFNRNTNQLFYAMYEFNSNFKVTIEYDETLDIGEKDEVNGFTINSTILYLQD